jgi:tetratricopeptide (TPR) repeat protein
MTIKDERPMLRDRLDNALPGATGDAAALYEEAVTAFNLYRGDPMALLAKAVEEAPRFAMAHIVSAHLLALATEPAATRQAAEVLAALRALPLTDREASHVAAIELVVAGEWTAAALVLDRHNMAYPRDLVALQAGHLIDFYRASARSLRDRIQRVLPAWSPAMPGYAVLLGMQAFGLEETGDYARAEAVGRRAVEIEPLDCWAHHAVAHVLEMEGRAADGIAWMTAREPHWSGDANFFRRHNWWHKALYHLDLGEPERALSLFDGPIRESRSMVALDLVDASALLWRLAALGHDVGERWGEVAAGWDSLAGRHTYPFNDWHAAMAYLGAGRIGEVDRLLEGYRRGGDGSEQGRWARDTAEPLIAGFRAFWIGDYQQAVDRLHGARFIANAFGGSHAQRDIIDWTLTVAAVRSRIAGVAEALANERLAMKPHSPINRAFLAGAGAAKAATPRIAA